MKNSLEMFSDYVSETEMMCGIKNINTPYCSLHKITNTEAV